MTDPETTTQPRRRKFPRIVPLLVVVLVLGLWFGSKAVAVAANLRLFYIPSGSMAPTLQAGDRVAVDLREQNPARGEIWLFNAPNGSTLVKRVVGLPGESIAVEGGRVRVDGQPLDEPYLTAPMTYQMAPLKLGPDEYFLLGDSRNASQDSHVWGPLGKSRFLGRAGLRYRSGSGIAGLK